MTGSSELVPGLRIGPMPSPGPHPDVDVIVLAAEEYQPSADRFPGTEVIHAPIDDDASRPMRPDEIATVIRTARQVADRLRAGRRVLSTCVMGLNRSSLVAALAMHAIHGFDADEILARIRRVRGPWALSNPHFERLLRLVVARPAVLLGAG